MTTTQEPSEQSPTGQSLTEKSSLPRATIRETVGVVAGVILPTAAKGVIIRRPRVVAMAERLSLDARAVHRMQRLRDKYGTGPLLLPNPIRPQAVILAPDHVHRVLAGSPEPFATASSEKRSTLSHFEPRQALISHGAARAERRALTTSVLDTDRPVHHLADGFLTVVDEEAGVLLNGIRRHGDLTWDRFATAWFRTVRRIVLGDAARDDHELTDLLAQLRSDANWAFLKPKRTKLRDWFHDRLETYLTQAAPGSLAEAIATTPASSRSAPSDQVPQWLFAFDAAGMATFRALALLAAHPEQTDRAREEIRGGERRYLAYLRACMLESVRLWPTTPMILRQSTEETVWETGVMPAGTGILIFAPFFHRDDERLPYANRFVPELWLEDRSTDHWPLIPFSEGPAVCPGQNLVLLLGSMMLATLLENRQIRLQPSRLDPYRPLPGTLNNYALRFTLTS